MFSFFLYELCLLQHSRNQQLFKISFIIIAQYMSLGFIYCTLTIPSLKSERLIALCSFFDLIFSLASEYFINHTTTHLYRWK